MQPEPAPAGAHDPASPSIPPADELADALKRALATQRPQTGPDGRWVERRSMSPLDAKDIR